MDDYISREAAEQVICEACERPGCPALWGDDCDSIDRLNTIPAADVRPVVRGHWKRTSWFVTCSVCEYTSADTDDEGPNIALNFCPNCGADMKGEDNENFYRESI